MKVVIASIAGAAITLASAAAHAEPPTPEQCEASSVKTQRLRLSHALVDARREALSCAAAECPTVIRRDCDRWVGEIDALIPTVVLVAQDSSGADLHDVSVKMDARDLKVGLDGAGIQVDPGLHVFTFTSRSDGARVEVRAVLREGERNRPIVGSFPSTAPPPPPRKSGPPVTTYVFGGISVVALAAWGYFGLRGISEYDDLKASCGAARACDPADVGAARDKMTIADVAFGVAVVSAGAAITFWILDGARGPLKPAMRLSF